MTPTLLATSSPKVLLIAIPGNFSPLTQTLLGPSKSISSSQGAISPPDSNILFCSSGFVGF